MSYDLYFYSKTEAAIAKSDIEAYVNKLPHVAQEADNEWVYNNEDTGVYGTFMYTEPSKDEQVEEQYFNGFSSTNFMFTINLLRPHFFGKECFDVVDQLTTDLGLYVLNPQTEEAPKQFAPGELGTDWQTTNDRIAAMQFDEFNLNYLDPVISNDLWAFNSNRQSLQKQLGDYYFVPEVFYLAKDREVVTLCVWTEHMAFALPKVDYVFIQRKIKKLFRTKTEEGLISYDDLLSVLGKYFADETSYKLLHPEASFKLTSEYNSLPLMTNFSDIG